MSKRKRIVIELTDEQISKLSFYGIYVFQKHSNVVLDPRQYEVCLSSSKARNILNNKNE